MALVMNIREKVQAPGGIPSNEGDLVLTTALKHAKLEEAKEQGVKAVIIVWMVFQMKRLESIHPIHGALFRNPRSLGQ